MERASVGELVSGARARRGLTQAALGRLAGVPQSHVAKIEAGADVRLSTLVRVLASLGLRLEARPTLEEMVQNPPPGSKLAAARDFGVDLGQLYANYRMRPDDRLAFGAANSHGLTELLG
jgi:transcriptional regulator with XRE-family HTH domain